MYTSSNTSDPVISIKIYSWTVKIFAVYSSNCTHLKIHLSVSMISRLWNLQSSCYLHSMFTSSNTSDPDISIKIYSWNVKIFAVYSISCTHLKIHLSVSMILRLWNLQSSRYLHSMFTSLNTSDPVISIKIYSWNVEIFAVYSILCMHLKIYLSASMISRLWNLQTS